MTRKKKRKIRSYKRFFTFIIIMALFAAFIIRTVTKDKEPIDQWSIMLINNENLLPESYQPNLVTIKDTDQQVDKRIKDDLYDMLDDAKGQGIYLSVLQGYRTPEQSQSLMDKEIQSLMDSGLSQEDAKVKALERVAPPYSSEHNAAIAIDIVTRHFYEGTWNDLEKSGQLAEQPEFQWLFENSNKYGFILRYPEDKVDITGIMYEPWHYRYVGKDHAKVMVENNLVLEEYWEYLKTPKLLRMLK